MYYHHQTQFNGVALLFGGCVRSLFFSPVLTLSVSMCTVLTC